jgi:hypothetical protein
MISLSCPAFSGKLSLNLEFILVELVLCLFFMTARGKAGVYAERSNDPIPQMPA